MKSPMSRTRAGLRTDNLAPQASASIAAGQAAGANGSEKRDEPNQVSLANHNP